MTPEGHLKKDLKVLLVAKEPDCFWFMPMTFGYGKKGIPDFVLCYRGVFCTIETKVHGRKEKPWQDQRGQEIAAAKGVRIQLHARGLKDIPAEVEKVRRIFDVILKAT